MSTIGKLLAMATRQARWLLIAGLLAGIFIPAFAGIIRPFIGELIIALLFVAALRTSNVFHLSAENLLPPLGTMLVLQLVFPLVAILIIWLTGWQGVLASSTILMLAASPISGSPNLTLMCGGRPEPALKMLLIGTALLPLTVVPVFLLADRFGDPGNVVEAAIILLVLIIAATVVALLARKSVFKNPSKHAVDMLDGIGAVLMAVVVVGLMDAVGPALWGDTGVFLKVLGFAFLLNFGMQFMGLVIARSSGLHEGQIALSIAAGNRNIALFLTALPVEITDPLLLFIGCYQVPMYLTPLIMRPVVNWLKPANTN